MSQFEKQLAENEKAEHLETEITLPPPRKKRGGGGEKGPQQVPKAKKQTLGSCRKCGYMSSQELCKACVILDGLNKNRPRIEVELDDEEEEASSSVRRKMEALDLRRSMKVDSL
jgi:cytoplasmic tRNA 2-thiolation protein 1